MKDRVRGIKYQVSSIGTTPYVFGHLVSGWGARAGLRPEPVAYVCAPLTMVLIPDTCYLIPSPVKYPPPQVHYPPRRFGTSPPHPTFA